MPDDECRFLFLGHFVEFVILVDRIEFLQQRFVGGARETGKQRNG